MTTGKTVAAAAVGLVMLLLVWEVAPARWAALLLIIFVLALLIQAKKKGFSFGAGA